MKIIIQAVVLYTFEELWTETGEFSSVLHGHTSASIETRLGVAGIVFSAGMNIQTLDDWHGGRIGQGGVDTID